MAFVTGLIVLDAPASALNNAGDDPMASTDNVVAVKKIKTPQGIFPYVSAQAFRYWLRTTLENHESEWVAAPVFREGKIAYTDANPIKNWDDDLFGYMRAPSKKAGALKDENITPLEENRDITRVSPFRVGTFVAIAPSPVIRDFGTMARQDGAPVPHEHEFYRAHLQGLVSLDLTCAGTFFDNEKVGYKNLDSFRREEAEKEAGKSITVRGQKAFRLPLEKRQERVSTLLRALGNLNGGAKQAIHYTDLTPAIVMFAVTKSGNHPFYRVLQASKTHQTEFSPEVFEELISTYEKDILSPIYIGWAKGFLNQERVKMEEAVNQFSNIKFNIGHPKQVIELLANDAADSKNAGWYE
jgi:CRISPR-associated protein Cst2